MILKTLYELYDRLQKDDDYGIAPPGFSPQKISFKVVLNEDGTLFEIQDARQPNDKEKLQAIAIQVPGEAKPSGSGINPCFLWDNQTYLLGRQPEDKKSGFGQERFMAFRDRHLRVESQIDCPEFSAVCRFLQSWDTNKIVNHSILNEVGPGFGVFQIEGRKEFVHEVPKILDWWNANQTKESSGIFGQCLITGESEVTIARLHPKIKGISGAQSAGASIVSFNDTAYESYGKSQSYNSPVSEKAAFRYGTALNALLTGPMVKKHRLQIGDATCVFWTETASEFEDIFAEVLGGGSNSIEEVQDETQRIRIERFLKALRTGEAFIDDRAPLNTPFYLLGLAPNAARVAVRFFHRSTIAELLEKLQDHQKCLSIVREFEKPKGKGLPDPEFPAIWQLLRQTARVSDEVPPLLAGALTRAIVQGCDYPEALFSAVLRRIHADRIVNYLRVALLKAVLVRNYNKTDIQIMLDTSEDTDPAYKLGRLFAVLEKIQEEGYYEQTQKRLGKTIRERYFSSASATPAIVMPRLEQLSTHHRRHLKHGRRTYFDSLIQEIKWPLSPKNKTKRVYTLEEQGLFILGYYHQRKAFFTKKEKPEENQTSNPNQNTQ